MASLRCSKCAQGIRYHGEPTGIEYRMISSENIDKITSFHFNSKDKIIDEKTKYPKLFRTDTIEEDFPGTIIKYWKCHYCQTLHFFDNLGHVKIVYSLTEMLEADKQVKMDGIIYDDYVWDALTEAALPVSEIILKYPANTTYVFQGNKLIFQRGNMLYVYEKVHII